MQINADFFWVISFFAIFILSFVITAFIFVYSNKNKLAREFVILIIAFCIWSFGRFVFGISNQKESVLFWVRFSYMGAILIPLLYLKFIFSFLNKKIDKTLLKVLYGVSIVFIVSSFTNYFINDVVPKGNFSYYDSPGKLYVYFNAYYMILIIYSLYLLSKALLKFKGLKKNQTSYLLLACFFGFFGSGTTFPLVYNVSLYPFGIILVPLYPLLIYYAIVRYRLMDMKLALTRGTLFAFVYAALLSIPVLLYLLHEQLLVGYLGDKWPLAPIVLAIALGSMGPGIYAKLKEKAEWALFKQQKQYQQTLLK
ncbi:MAG: histidine kinase N-terminal 7TM domain-containing protein, partial [Elusimicrobiota bacterium]